MRIRRRLPIVLVVVLVAAILALVVQLRKHAPPEPARLLPYADGYIYINLQRIRRANLAGPLPVVSHEPEYEKFIAETGFQFERDLEQVAFAIHYPSPGVKPGVPPQLHFSEVFVGKIQGERLRAYLARISSSVEDYRSVDIYSIPIEGRTFRVAILGVDTVAASNHGDPQLIRGIIDRSRKLASPFGGPPLLKQYYKYVPLDVPFASLAWAVFKVAPAGGGASAPGLMDLSFLFPKPAVVVASVRYLGAVRFRAEAFTGSEEEAQRVTEQLSTFLSIFHTAETTVANQGTDPDVKAFFASLKVQQHKDHAVLTATVPLGFIRKAVTEPPKELVLPPPPGQSPPPVPPAAKRPHQ
jgi:hypothetical protein